MKKLDSGPRKSSSCLTNGAQATEQKVRAVPVSLHAELVTQFAPPEDRLGWTAFHEEEGELSCLQDQSEDATQAFHSLKAQVFDIQAPLLVKTIAIFDASARTTVGVERLGDGFD